MYTSSEATCSPTSEAEARWDCERSIHADTLVEQLTVREMLLYTAEMKLEMSVSMTHKRKRVDQLLKDLALEVCQNVRIGSTLSRGISGLSLITSTPCDSKSLV